MNKALNRQKSTEGECRAAFVRYMDLAYGHAGGWITQQLWLAWRAAWQARRRQPAKATSKE